MSRPMCCEAPFGAELERVGYAAYNAGGDPATGDSTALRADGGTWNFSSTSFMTAS